MFGIDDGDEDYKPKRRVTFSPAQLMRQEQQRRKNRRQKRNKTDLEKAVAGAAGITSNPDGYLMVDSGAVDNVVKTKPLQSQSTALSQSHSLE